MPRSERLYLSAIVEASGAIGGYIAGVSADEFHADDVLRRAVLQRLTEIGDAASRLSPGPRSRYPDIPWADIVGFRNIAVRASFAVDRHMVRLAAIRNAPTLAEQVGRLLGDPEIDGREVDSD